jgi:S-adenosylmethionine decarboxylase
MHSRTLGTHCLLDLFDCQAAELDDLAVLEQWLRDAAAAAGAEVLGVLRHRFRPQSVSLVCLLAESHISLHTWPESRQAAADIYTCGESCDPQRACDKLLAFLRPARHSLRIVPRGQPPVSDAI